ncbi:MAG: hypothetical protein CL484_04775 [Acidobacteria bacterium]|nr:hypothetical protein [Acidobacteriota bacterium]
MRRPIFLSIVTIISVSLMVVSNEARQSRASLALHQVDENLYMLANAPSVQGMGGGGNTAIFVTSSGVVLVDTKISGYGADILEQVRGITDLPISTIINTHTHWDHSGSNVEFSDSVNFIVHENTLSHMSRPTCNDGAGYRGGSITNCESFKGDNSKYLPKTTFSTRTSLFSGIEQVDLYYFGRGHTDGDTFVVFKEARAMHTGDMFARRGLPYLDVDNTNGSAIEFGLTLEKAVAGIAGVDIIIPGHDNILRTWDDFVNYSGFYNDLLTKAQTGLAAGQSPEEVIEAYTVPQRYSDFEVTEQRLAATVQHISDGR